MLVCGILFIPSVIPVLHIDCAPFAPIHARTRAGLHYCLRVAREITRAVVGRVKVGMELGDSVDVGESGLVIVVGI